MKLQKAVIRMAYVLKPILFKLFPIEWLKKVKAGMIQKNFTELEQMEIEPYEKEKYPMISVICRV